LNISGFLKAIAIRTPPIHISILTEQQNENKGVENITTPSPSTPLKHNFTQNITQRPVSRNKISHPVSFLPVFGNFILRCIFTPYANNFFLWNQFVEQAASRL